MQRKIRHQKVSISALDTSSDVEFQPGPVALDRSPSRGRTARCDGSQRNRSSPERSSTRKLQPERCTHISASVHSVHSFFRTTSVSQDITQMLRMLLSVFNRLPLFLTPTSAGQLYASRNELTQQGKIQHFRCLHPSGFRPVARRYFRSEFGGSWPERPAPASAWTAIPKFVAAGQTRGLCSEQFR